MGIQGAKSPWTGDCVHMYVFSEEEGIYIHVFSREVEDFVAKSRSRVHKYNIAGKARLKIETFHFQGVTREA